MENYYQYFVDKGNHPNKEDILTQEKEYSFNDFCNNDALYILNIITNEARIMNKSIAIRITYQNEIILQYFMDNINYSTTLSWLKRKEKMTKLSNHSSYYTFLDNINSHRYDMYIKDEAYGLCGGSFPLIIDNKILGCISVSGLRPHEDHEIIIKALKKLKLMKEGLNNE